MLTPDKFLQLQFHHLEYMGLHLDTVIVSTLILSSILSIIYVGYRNYNPYYLTPLQCAIEWVFDIVSDRVLLHYKQRDPFLESLGVALFSGILAYNLCDILPATSGIWAQSIWGRIGSFKLTPTEDFNVAFSLGLIAFSVKLIYLFKDKGFINACKYLCSEPMGTIKALPINLLLQLVGIFTKPLSLIVRLFGNIFTGGIIFIVLGLMPPFVNFAVGTFWRILHFPILIIQAAIFAEIAISSVNPKTVKPNVKSSVSVYNHS